MNIARLGGVLLLHGLPQLQRQFKTNKMQCNET